MAVLSSSPAVERPPLPTRAGAMEQPGHGASGGAHRPPLPAGIPKVGGGARARREARGAAGHEAWAAGGWACRGPGGRHGMPGAMRCRCVRPTVRPSHAFHGCPRRRTSSPASSWPSASALRRRRRPGWLSWRRRRSSRSTWATASKVGCVLEAGWGNVRAGGPDTGALWPTVCPLPPCPPAVQAAGGGVGGMLKAVIDTVVGNLQLSISNVHIRWAWACGDAGVPGGRGARQPCGHNEHGGHPGAHGFVLLHGRGSHQTIVRLKAAPGTALVTPGRTPVGDRARLFPPALTAAPIPRRRPPPPRSHPTPQL